MAIFSALSSVFKPWPPAAIFTGRLYTKKGRNDSNSSDFLPFYQRILPEPYFRALFCDLKWPKCRFLAIFSKIFTVWPLELCRIWAHGTLGPKIKGPTGPNSSGTYLGGYCANFHDSKVTWKLLHPICALALSFLPEPRDTVGPQKGLWGSNSVQDICRWPLFPKPYKSPWILNDAG